jgi:hypothetical protein
VVNPSPYDPSLSQVQVLLVFWLSFTISMEVRERSYSFFLSGHNILVLCMIILCIHILEMINDDDDIAQTKHNFNDSSRGMKAGKGKKISLVIPIKNRSGKLGKFI